MAFVDPFDQGTGFVDPFEEERRRREEEATAAGLEPTPSREGFRSVAGQVSIPEQIGRPILEMGGAGIGGAVGMASPLPGGTAIGGVGGFGIGKGLADVAYGKQPQEPAALARKTLEDLGLGALYETAGWAGGKALGWGAEQVGKVAKPVMGWLSGTGKAAVEEALTGGKPFRDAMRNQTTPQEIVETTRQTLTTLKANRGNAYRKELESLKGAEKEVDPKPIFEKMDELMKRYEVRFVPKKEGGAGALDFSQSTLKEGAPKFQDLFDEINKWPWQSGGATPYKLDVLKRRIGDIYSESSASRAAITEMEQAIKGVIEREVPQYAQMTKNYSEATRLIKDLEAAFLLKKEGLSGRSTADAALRRLNTAMKNNYTLRKELLDIMSKQGGQPITEMVAGHAMSEVVPRGLAYAPTFIGGAAGGIKAAMGSLNPAWLLVLMEASPRVAGETLNLLGTHVLGTGVSQAAGKAAAYLTVPPAESALRGIDEWERKKKRLGDFY